MVEHVTQPLRMGYEVPADMDELQRRFSAFCEACVECGCHAEGMLPGRVVVAVPWGKKNEYLKLVLKCAGDAGLDMRECVRES